MIIPKPVYYLSAMGLLPVFAGAIGSFNLIFLGEEFNRWLQESSILFSAMILSFLGGSLFIFEILLKKKNRV